MAATYPQPVSEPVLSGWLDQPAEGRRRAIAIALTIAVHLLLALLLLNLTPDRIRRPFSDALSTFTVAPEAGKSEPAPVRRQQRERQRSAPPAPQRPTPPPPEVKLPDFLKLTKDQFAATDLAALPRPADRGSTAGADTGAASAADSGSAYGPGAGPGGARLYNAEWVREPTRAELSTYLPPAAAGSWGEIACRTIPNNRVENCQLLGESPLGSKLSTGLRRAAWQFLVRPPRLGGKPMVGEWVRIRITLTEAGLETRR